MAVATPTAAHRPGRALDALLQRTTSRQRDAVLAAGLGLLAIGVHVGFDEDVPAAIVAIPDVGAILVLVGMALTLVWRRVAPERVMAVAGLLTAAYYFTGNGTPAAMLLLTFALYAVTAFGTERREGWLSLLACWFFMSLSFLSAGGPAALVTASYVLSGFTFTVAWALGTQTRTRLELTEELRRRNAQLALLRERERDELVTEERRRIARELHDVVSHTVSVVVVQAAAARRVADVDPGAVTEALGAIERAAREAMGELRTMLGLLRDDEVPADDTPTPGTDALAALVEELRGVGMPVRAEGELPDDLSPGLALTVHRIVQEALTNVLRHAEDVSEVVVTVAAGGDAVTLEVVDDGRPAGFTAGAGTGLVGMRERAALHGGEVEAGPLGAGRGYRVRAVLPVGVRR